MSSRPWKDTNSRDKTNNINVIHCDELITDELTAKNAIFNNLNIGQKVITNNFDVSNVEITDTMSVPEISINNIGNKVGEKYVNFISPFSTPFAVFKDVRVNDTSMNQSVRGNDISVNIISGFDNSSIKIISDVSFNANITSQQSLFNNIYSSNDLQINSDVSCNGNIIANTISLEILQHINDGIIQVVSDISVDKITVREDVSINILDTSLIEVSVIDNLYSDKIAFNSNTIIDGSVNINDLSVNSIETNKNNSIEFRTNVNTSQNVNINDNIKTNVLELETSFNNDVSFDTIKADISVNKISVNKINNYNEETIIIDSDVSINNSSVLSATIISKEEINFMNVYEQGGSNDKSAVRPGTIFFFKNDNVNSVLFKNYRKNYLALNKLGSNIDIDLSYIELYDNSYNQSGYQLRNYPLNHEEKYDDLDASWNFTIDGDESFTFKSINIRHDVSRNYKLDISAIVKDLEDDVVILNRILIIPSHEDISLNIEKIDNQYVIPPGDTSFVFITPIVNEAYDVSFKINISDQPRPEEEADNIKSQIITLEYNRQPEWKYMILTPSNDTHAYDSSIGLHGSNYDQSWNTSKWYGDESVNKPSKTIDATYSYTADVSYTFFVQMMNQPDSSYFYLDLSSIDPEGYEVSYNNNVYDYIIPNNGKYEDISGFVQNNVTDWSLSEFVDGSRIKIRVLEPGNNGIDMSFEIISKDNYLDRQNYQKKIVNVKKINRQPQWNHMILSASNSDLLLRDQSWNTSSNPSIRNSSDFSNQFYLYFDPCKNYVYSDGIKDLSHYYLDLSALDFEGFDVSYDVSNVKGDLSWAWVDNSRIVIDISDTVELGSDTSLQIISIDDWIDRPNPEQRIVKFKHISSEVIKGFDISDGGSIYTISRNTNYGNSYIYILTNDEIKIDPSYDDTYNDFFSVIDYSINNILKSNNNDSVEINDNKIKINISSRNDISFNLLLNNILMYKFITLDNLEDALFPMYKNEDNQVLKCEFNHDNKYYLCFALPHISNKIDFSFNDILKFNKSFDNGYLVSFSAPGNGGRSQKGGAIKSENGFTRAVFSGATGGGGDRSDFIGIPFINDNSGVTIETNNDSSSITITYGGNTPHVLDKTIDGSGSTNFEVTTQSSNNRSDLIDQVQTIYIPNKWNYQDPKGFNGGIGDSSSIIFDNSYNNIGWYSEHYINDYLQDELVVFLGNLREGTTDTTSYPNRENLYWATEQYTYAAFVSGTYLHVSGDIYYAPELKNGGNNQSDTFENAKENTKGKGVDSEGGRTDGSSSNFETAINWPDYRERAPGWAYDHDPPGGAYFGDVGDGDVDRANDGPGGLLRYNDDQSSYFTSLGNSRLQHRALNGGSGVSMSEDDISNNTQFGSILANAINEFDNDDNDFSYNFYNQTSGGNGQNIVNNILDLSNETRTTYKAAKELRSDISSIGQIKYIPDYPHFVIYKLST